MGGAWISYREALSQHREQLINRGLQLTSAIDQAYQLAAREEEIRFAVDEVVRDQEGISRITVATADPFTIWASTYHPGTDPDLDTQQMLQQLGDAIDEGRFGHGQNQDGDLLVVVPLGWNRTDDDTTALLGAANLTSVEVPRDRYRGAIFVRFDWAQIQAGSAQVFRQTALTSIGAVLLIAFLTIYLVRKIVVERINRVGGVVQSYEAGDRDIRVQPRGRDEIADVSRSLDNMLDSLQDSTELAARTFWYGPMLSSISDPETGRIYDVNSTWISALGYDRDEAVNRTAADLGIWVRPDDRDEYVRRLKTDEVVLNFETAFRSRDGPIREVLIAGDILDFSGGPRLLTIAHDISERKRMEEVLRQTQKMDAIGQLTGGVAHDFNNLLQVIMGNADLLASNRSVDPQIVEPILRAAERGAELTSQLLAYARKQTLLPKPVDMAEVVDGMQSMLSRTLGETIAITTASDDRLWPAFADSNQTQTALLNLALNARDAMPNGGDLKIRCSNVTLDENNHHEFPEANRGDYVALIVQDSGKGMSDDVRKRAVEPFFTTKGVGEGSGLGLSMVYGFAQQSGGHLGITSRLGEGTTVTLLLPRSIEASSLTRNADEPASRLPRGNGELILVLEDNTDVRALVVGFLKDLNYRSIEAAIAPEAIALLDAGHPVQAVISDVVLPGGISGRDFATRIAVDHPGIPVALMSGHPLEAGSGELSDINLVKPFKIQTLATLLSEFVR